MRLRRADPVPPRSLEWNAADTSPVRLVEPDAPRTAAVPKRSSAWSLSTLARFGGPVAAVLAAVSFGTSVAARPPTIESEATCPADEEALARARAAKRAPYGVAARQLAAEALAPKTRPSGEHPLMKHRAEVTRRLELLGLFKASGDHVHISDVDLEHGGAVLRAAVGLVPLVKTVTSTMSVDGVPEEFAKSKLSPSQFERYRAVYEEGDEGPPPSFEVLVQGAADELERMMLEKRLRTLQLAAQRERLPEAKRIFVNMSFGQSPDRMAKTIAEEVLSAPPGSPLHALAKETLGEPPVVIPQDISFEPPPFSRCDEPFEVGPDDAPWEGPPEDLPEFDFEKMEAQVEALKQRLAYPALMKVMQTTDFRARMDTARAELTTALFEAQKLGILVFEAAGNEYADAKRSGRPELSKSGSTGTRGLLRIGALDLGRLADPRDDRVATFSAAGRIALAAQGTKLPVWIQMGEVEESEGTSFASPLALGVGLATAANAKDADVTPAGITKLLTDPRAVHDIRGTERDGAGALDDFAAILLAANPKLERATIDRAWKMLGAKDADVPAVKRLLGLR